MELWNYGISPKEDKTHCQFCLVWSVGFVSPLTTTPLPHPG